MIVTRTLTKSHHHQPKLLISRSGGLASVMLPVRLLQMRVEGLPEVAGVDDAETSLAMKEVRSSDNLF